MTDHDNNDDKDENKKKDKESNDDKFKDRQIRLLGASSVTADEEEEKSDKVTSVVYSCQDCGAQFSSYQSYSAHHRAKHQLSA